MTGERGASRWTIAALLAVIIGVVVALGVAQGWFGGDDDTPGAESSGVETTQPSADRSTSSSSASITTTTAAAITTTAPTAAVGDHPLCALHDDLVAAIGDHLPVEGPDDLQAYVTAQVAYHQDAIDVLDPPDRDGFTGMLAWYDAQVDYYEPLEWNPSPGLEYLLENPPPQPDPEATAAVIATLEELCGVVPTQDTSTP